LGNTFDIVVDLAIIVEKKREKNAKEESREANRRK